LLKDPYNMPKKFIANRDVALMNDVANFFLR
jgi:hypothetical protein